jgi:UDPglucose 6-dehydrogenase
MQSQLKIAVIGLWHLGEIYSAGLAELGRTVIGIDADTQVIENLQKNIPPLAEPQLAELLAEHQKSGNLFYTIDLSAIKDCDVVWFTFDTPVDDHDEVDVSTILNSVERTIPYLQNGVLIAVSSQIPVGTSEKIIGMIKTKRPELSFDYVYSPENLRLGDAVRCFLEPGRVVVGATSGAAISKMKDIFAGAKGPNGAADVVSMSPASAEMVKHALNAFLATSISFTNDIADISAEYGADVEDVVRALKTDPRVGPKTYLFAGLGFSGGTLGRDLKAIMKAGSAKHIDTPVIKGVFEKNSVRNAFVGDRLKKELGDLKKKTFAMFGVTYKAGTSTLRRSQPLEIEKGLRDAGATLKLYDPWAKPEEVAAMTPSSFFNDPYAAAEGADAILLMTPWKDFGNIDFKKLKNAAKGNLFFDTCNILCDKEREISAAGFHYIRIGR